MTAMTNKWLIRRSVRSPVAVTSCISSFVCRLPAMRRSPVPRLTRATDFAAAAWLCGTSMISALRSSPVFLRDLVDPRLRSNQYGNDQSIFNTTTDPMEPPRRCNETVIFRRCVVGSANMERLRVCGDAYHPGWQISPFRRPLE